MPVEFDCGGTTRMIPDANVGDPAQKAAADTVEAQFPGPGSGTDGNAVEIDLKRVGRVAREGEMRPGAVLEVVGDVEGYGVRGRGLVKEQSRILCDKGSADFANPIVGIVLDSEVVAVGTVNHRVGRAVGGANPIFDRKGSVERDARIQRHRIGRRFELERGLCTESWRHEESENS